MEVVRKPLNLGLEVARLVTFLVMALVFFLFFTLVLDVVGLLVYGGWNPLLGKWPIFSGTISAAIYGSRGAVIALLVSFAFMARMVAGPVTPGFLQFLERKADGKVPTDPNISSGDGPDVGA